MQKNPCGNVNCKNPVCETCVTDWYKQAKPGHRVDRAWTECPFCKTRPKFKILSATGADLKKAVFPRSWTDDVYGWCLDCNQILVERSHDCAQLEPPEFTEFKCGCKDLDAIFNFSLTDVNDNWETAEDFDEWARNNHRNHQIFKNPHNVVVHSNAGVKADAFEKAYRTAIRFGLFEKGYKLCPACGNGVKKTYGCDHMTCFCGCHWCWSCGVGHYDERTNKSCLRTAKNAKVMKNYMHIYDHWNNGECVGYYVYASEKYHETLNL